MLGVAGLTGSMTGINRKESFTGKCLLWFYVIGILLFLIILSGLGTFFFVGSTIIFGPNCTVGSTTKLIAELYNHSQTVN